jgi:5'-nucleotidase/UDP-sugar diphosphatase
LYPSLGNVIGEDEALLNLLQPYVDQVESALSEVIGYAKGTFSMDHVRDRETALGDIIADSMLWYTKRLGVDFAIQNGGASGRIFQEAKLQRD